MASSKLLVAAIDFGTTFSGYAYSFVHDYKSDPLKIQTNHWIGGGHISLKAPTTVLFTPQQAFYSFGYEAEDKYAELAEEGTHTNWYLFQRFKMLLHENQALSRTTPILDEHKKPMTAIKIFSSGIAYLKKGLMEQLQKKVTDVREDDVHWVLTVPAIWNESAKQLMRESAVEAGIKSNSLTLALEPEAASVLCKRLPIERLHLGTARDFDAFESGKSYILLDMGGGTVDITVHTIQCDGSLAEIAKASGGAWGGTQVDNAFIEFLDEITGNEFMKSYRSNNTGDFFDLMREFEVKKRTVSNNTTGKITFRIPVSFPSDFESKTGKNLMEYMSTTQHAGRVHIKRDKIQLDADIFKGFFTRSISETIAHVQEILQVKIMADINTILMVGGYAESEIVQEKIKDAFPTKQIIVPVEAGLAVLKGAVMFGHDPQVVKSRVSKYTYGVATNTRFIKGIHPEKCKFLFGGIYMCCILFDPFVRAGDLVPIDSVVTSVYTSDINDVKEGVGIYMSTNKTPTYVTDADCFKLGNIYLDEPDHRVEVEMQFGGTEFSVQITDLDTKVKRFNTFDFLCH